MDHADRRLRRAGRCDGGSPAIARRGRRIVIHRRRTTGRRRADAGGLRAGGRLAGILPEQQTQRAPDADPAGQPVGRVPAGRADRLDSRPAAGRFVRAIRVEDHRRLRANGDHRRSGVWGDGRIPSRNVRLLRTGDPQRLEDRRFERAARSARGRGDDRAVGAVIWRQSLRRRQLPAGAG